MADPLELLERLIIRDCGAEFEGSIFSVLRDCEYVLRSPEFAIADGAIDCDNQYGKDKSYMQRFWEADNRSAAQDASRLGLYDLKATLSTAPGFQAFVTTKGQQRRVAFYICICALDPTFIDLIPNLAQEREALDGDMEDTRKDDDDEEISVNVSRLSRLSPAASGLLDQCDTPCRMPIGMLPTAIKDVRHCMRTGEVYVNKWTGVRFPEWKPMLTRSTQFLKSRDQSPHHTAYTMAMDMYRTITYLASSCAISMDFMNLQPRLGDYKFVVRRSDGKERQVVIQDKIDGRDRKDLNGVKEALHEVFIARGTSAHGATGFYFTALDRFDFLCHHFRFRTKHGFYEEMFFIPECELPESFFTTDQVEANFERESFKPFRMKYDKEGQWVQQVLNIINQYPTPRSDQARPHRQHQNVLNVGDDRQGDLPSTDNVRRKDRLDPWYGRGKFEGLLRHRHRKLFDDLMTMCALRKKGLLLTLATNHPFGDFCYTQYNWTEQEARDYLEMKHPPKAAHHLPKYQTVVPICYYARFAVSTHQGSAVTGAQFRRLNCTSQKRLVLWDIFGPDCSREPPPPAVIPSEDIQPSEEQRNLLLADTSRKRTLTGEVDKWGAKVYKDEGPNYTPLLSYLLSEGYFAPEYRVHSGGPLSFSSSWKSILDILDRFISPRVATVEHPRGVQRQTAEYRYSLQTIHQRLAQEHFSGRTVEQIEAADAEEALLGEVSAGEE